VGFEGAAFQARHDGGYLSLSAMRCGSPTRPSCQAARAKAGAAKCACPLKITWRNPASSFFALQSVFCCVSARDRWIASLALAMTIISLLNGLGLTTSGRRLDISALETLRPEKMIYSDLRSWIHSLKRAGSGPRLLLLGGVAAVVAYLVSGMVTVSFQSNPMAWAYQWAVGSVLIGLAVWAVAKIIGYPPAPSD
jgi:hypothetical protein